MTPELLLMYTTWNLALVVISALSLIDHPFFHSFVGANTVIIAIMVTYIGIRTRWSQLPETYYRLVGTFGGAEVSARILDLCVHYLPLAIVIVPHSWRYYAYAIVMLSIWFVSMWVTKKLQWMYKPLREEIMVEAWIVLLISAMILYGALA